MTELSVPVLVGDYSEPVQSVLIGWVRVLWSSVDGQQCKWGSCLQTAVIVLVHVWNLKWAASTELRLTCQFNISAAVTNWYIRIKKHSKIQKCQMPFKDFQFLFKMILFRINVHNDCVLNIYIYIWIFEYGSFFSIWCWIVSRNFSELIKANLSCRMLITAHISSAILREY